MLNFNSINSFDLIPSLFGIDVGAFDRDWRQGLRSPLLRQNFELKPNIDK